MADRLSEEYEPDDELGELPEDMTAEEYERVALQQTETAMSNAEHTTRLGLETDAEGFDAEYVRSHPAEYGNIDGPSIEPPN